MSLGRCKDIGQKKQKPSQDIPSKPQTFVLREVERFLTLGKVVLFMQAGTDVDTENKSNIDLDEELADVLIAISVISKRLARKLTEQSEQEE